ncbi:MAG: gliding motility-associated protein GldE [Flavobacteriales bacterium]|nr:gliding motility-associated protein GldE [Flavobacteriales bacterium]
MDPEPALLFLITPILINWMPVAYIGSLLILLLLSALISGSEVAFFSLSQTDLDQALISKSNSDQHVVKLLERPKKLLATILISNNFINIAIVILSHLIIENYFSSVSIKVNFIYFTANLKILIELVAITFVILLFGEVLPKIYANRNALSFASKMAGPIHILNNLLSFLSYPLIGLNNSIESRLRKKTSDMSVEKLSQAFELTKGNATQDEQKILKGIVSFGNTEARQIMIPRMDIFALSHDEKYEDILPIIVKRGFSRIPIYKDNTDTIIGVLYAKDLLPYLNEKNFNWLQLLREPFFVPENKKLDDLLKEFQEKKIHIAIVVDEYGGTSGLLSLEDIIEEIVGEISDEFDTDELNYSKIDDNNFIFEGKISLKDFCQVINIEEEIIEEAKGEAETLAGFLLELKGKFPSKNDKLKFKFLLFKIEALDEKRIKQIKVTLNQDNA